MYDVLGNVYKHGVCVYVSDKVSVANVNNPYPNILTSCLTSFNVFVIVVYRPPSNTEVENNLLLSFLSDFCADKEVIILGDFNLPNLGWSDSDMTNCSALERSFLNLFNLLGLTQWIKQSTFPRSGNVLDLVLTSELDRLGSIEVCPPLPGCDHCPVVCDYVFETQNDEHDSSHLGPCRRAWSRGRFTLMRQFLTSIDWDFELAHRDCNDSFVHFARIISDLAGEFVPEQLPNRGKQPHFQTRPPTSLIHRRQRAWNTYKTVRRKLGRKAPASLEAYGAFAKINKELRAFTVSSQCHYEANLIDRSRENPKLLHSFIRSKKVGCPSVGP